MEVTPKQQRRKARGQEASFSLTIGIAVLISLAVIFFLFGLYMGAKFSTNHETKLRRQPNAPQVLRNLDKIIPLREVESFEKRETLRGVQSLETNKHIDEFDPKNLVSTINPNGLSKDIFLQSSLLATSSSFLSSPFILNLSKRQLIASWIYLSPDYANNNMRTIFSNKMAGCGTEDDRMGIAVFVNPWLGNDRELYIEYGDSNSGCNKIQSHQTIEIGTWTHIAVLVDNLSLSIFIDGKEVQKVTLSSTMNTKRDFVIGKYGHSVGSDAYPFNGNISTFGVVYFDEADSSLGVSNILAKMKDIDAIRHVQGLKLLYPLRDAAEQIPNSMAVDALCESRGQYTFPIVRLIPGISISFVDGINGRPVTKEMLEESDKLALERKNKIKAGMHHAWSGYKRYAWGSDELKPLSKRGVENWGGMGVTLVDSLDTLWLMGMKDEFKEARDWVANSLTFKHAGTVSVFETTIRELGGLLSAYDLSRDVIFLDKAKELGRSLENAFNSHSGLPYSQINMNSGQGVTGWSGSTAILSELGSLQIEFRYLAQETGEQHFETKSMKPMQIMLKKKPSNGLFPIKVNLADGNFADSHVTFGALGDSFYEYLLKLWLQGGKKEDWLRKMYDDAMQGMVDLLLKASSPSELAYISDYNGHSNEHKMDHLVCFMPGVLALGAYNDPLGFSSKRAKRDLAIAKALMYTCYQMYARMASGISAEYVEFREGQDFRPGSNVGFYILRPETAESLFVLHQLTGDPIYRDWAWEIWEAIDRVCRTEIAYGALSDVQVKRGKIDDRMESFFLAETIKYLYLVQDPDKPVDLTKFVFNTEAHPLSVLRDDHQPILPKANFF